MMIEQIKKTIDTEIGSIISCACRQFIKNETYLEDRGNEKCLRDIVNDKLTEVFKLNTNVWVWGKTCNPQQLEISFKNILYDWKPSSFYLPEKLGGIDIVVSSNTDLNAELVPCKIARKELFKINTYIYLNKNKKTLRIFNEEIVCIEIKVLNDKKIFTAKNGNRKCDDSTYFLTGKNWNDPSLKEYQFDPNYPSHNCSGQILSDIARGAYILNNQSDINRFYLMGVIIGDGTGIVVDCDGVGVENPCECIEKRILGLIEIIKKMESFLYGDNQFINPLILKCALSKINFNNIKVHEIIKKDDKQLSGIFMYPYHIILEKKMNRFYPI